MPELSGDMVDLNFGRYGFSDYIKFSHFVKPGKGFSIRSTKQIFENTRKSYYWARGTRNSKFSWYRGIRDIEIFDLSINSCRLYIYQIRRPGLPVNMSMTELQKGVGSAEFTKSLKTSFLQDIVKLYQLSRNLFKPSMSNLMHASWKGRLPPQNRHPSFWKITILN